MFPMHVNALLFQTCAGGTTACVIAGRLASADPSLRILILESGQHSRDVPRHVQPARYAENLAPDSTTVSRYIAKPSAHLNGRAAIVSCGRAVGGGSTVNCELQAATRRPHTICCYDSPRASFWPFAAVMLYVRGAASDYDDWAALGNKGWSFNELLPLIKKVTTVAM